MKTNSLYIKTASTFDPGKFVLSKDFLMGHRSNLWFWIPATLLSLIFVFLEFFPFDKFNSQGGAYISHLFTVGLYIAIFSLGVYGLWLVLSALSKISVETSIAIKLRNNAAEELRAIRNREKQRIDLDAIDRLFPENPSAELSMLRLAKNIIEEAKDRKFESAVVLMQPYKEESVSELFNINIIQKTALQLGILGTFIGLIAAFAGLMSSGDLSSDSLVTRVIPSLEYSFTTSVTGLQVAIVVSLFMVLVRKNQDLYFKHMEDATNALLALARNAINKDDFLTEFSQITHSVKQLDEKVYEQTREIGAQTEAISNGLHRLHDVNNKFNGFLNNLSDQEKKFMEEVKTLHDALSPEQIVQQVRSGMQQSTELINTFLQQGLSERMAKYDELDKSSLKIHTSLSRVANGLEQQQNTIQEYSRHVDQIKVAFERSLAEVRDSQQDFIGKITGSHFSNKVREDFLSVGSEFTKLLSQDLKTIETGLKAYTKEMGVFNGYAKRYYDNRLLLEKRVLIVASVAIGVIGIISLLKSYSII